MKANAMKLMDFLLNLTTPGVAGGEYVDTLRVTSGLHRGASMELTADEYLIGSDAGCDIVLRDSGVAPRQWRLVREAGGISLRDIRTPTPRFVSPENVRREGPLVERAYDLGGVAVSLFRRVREKQPTPAAEQIATSRSPTWIFSSALFAGLVLTAIALATAQQIAVRMNPGIEKRIVDGSQALLAQGFNAVRFIEHARGGLQLTGLVADRKEETRLREWLARTEYRDARLSVQPVATLIDQVRQTLATDAVKVSFDGRRLRVDGMTGQLSTKQRIRLLADELHGIVDIDDRVAYVEGVKPNGETPLPVRISDVMIGNPSYFRTDTGVRYFAGGVLPDGAEVVAIEPTRILFRIAGNEVVYHLD